MSKVNQNAALRKIVADIGGTNARFAMIDSDGLIQDQTVLKGVDYPDFVSAYQAYMKLVDNPPVSDAAIAIANPIDGDMIKMTNHNWEFSIEDSRKKLGLDSLVFKNDFEALAMSIPFLTGADVYQVGGNEIKKKLPIGVLGPGTGLGVSGLIHSGEKWVPLSTEGGHVSLSPTSDREIQIFQECKEYYEHVSAERLISGSGLQLLYSVICKLDKVEAIPDITPYGISKCAIENSEPQCEETLDVFSGLLGGVAGNLALTLGAKGGIYIGGGIVPKLGGYFDESPFRERFDAKGRFSKYLKDIPVFVIQTECPALIGIKQVFDR